MCVLVSCITPRILSSSKEIIVHTIQTCMLSWDVKFLAQISQTMVFLQNIFFLNKCFISVWGAESLTTVDGYVKIMKHVRKN